MATMLTSAMVWEKISVRAIDANKGCYGRATLVAGCERYRGAAALCAEGAARVGAGLVTLCAIEPVLSAVIARLPECCLLPCQNQGGGICAAEAGRILDAANTGTCLAIGPGLGQSKAIRALVAALIRGATVPLVLDADGLNAVTGGTLPHPKSDVPMILTPHPGELSRLTGLCVSEIQADRETVALRYARENNCILVLKGSHTLIAAPDGTLFENPTGNPGLARGGSGDVLTGMIAGFAAEGLSPLDAAVCGVYLHGAAADRAASERGQYGMLPQDLFAALGTLFARAGR